MKSDGATREKLVKRSPESTIQMLIKITSDDPICDFLFFGKFAKRLLKSFIISREIKVEAFRL